MDEPPSTPLITEVRSVAKGRQRLILLSDGREIVFTDEACERAGLLDDHKFARAWVEDRKRVSPRGRRMLRYELLGRGIDPESVDIVTEGIDDRETAFALARSRVRGSLLQDYDAFLAKVGGFLRRRGFDYSVAAEAARAAWQEATATLATSENSGSPTWPQ